MTKTIKVPPVRVLTITWGTSRGSDTYGYTLCTLRENGAVKAKCNGGGYDMRGTALGNWLAAEYQARLMKIASRFHGIAWDGERYQNLSAPNEKIMLYGGTFYDTPRVKKLAPHVELDGGCGFSSMQRIAEAIGLQVRQTDASKKLDIITVTDTRGEV